MTPATPQRIDEIEPLLIALQGQLGVVVPDGKRNQLMQSLTPILSQYQLNSAPELAEKLQKKNAGELRSQVLDVITRCYSGWMLSEEIKNILHQYILAQLAEKARIWVVGCGHGQLAYTLAMEIANFEHVSGESKGIQIIASDIPQSQNRAAEAIYSNLELGGLSDEYKALYLSKNDSESWQVKDKIRQRVSFEQCELTHDFQSLGRMDLIICPEILVYFTNGVKAGILSQFSTLLKPGGILLTEHNQLHASATSEFERVDHQTGIFYRKKSM